MKSIVQKYSSWNLAARVFQGWCCVRAGATLAALALMAVGVQAQRQGGAYPAVVEASGAGAQGRIEVLGERYAQLPGVAGSQSRLVVYRIADGQLGVTGIFVNDRYHGSLVPGAWSQLCVSSGAVELATRQTQAAERPARDLYDAISALTLQGGQVHYLRVDMDGGRAVLRPVVLAQALQELVDLREQVHTVSRAAQACRQQVQAVGPAAVPVSAHTYTLSADALFAFNQADRSGVTLAGLRSLEQLLVQLRQEYSRIDQVQLVGHADPLGDALRNEQLALQRAQTVREFMVSSGQVQAPMAAMGRGSQELVVTACPKQITPQAIACHQPNRRVAVQVTGVRR
ncbi:MAG: OmpA family protein [Limnohabitans sp.]